MAYSYLLTNKAKTDIDSILAYIINDLSNLVAAKELFDRIDKSIKTICEFPKSCPLYETKYLQLETIRYKKIKNYLLFYVVDDRNKQLLILRVIYSKRRRDQIELF